MIPTYISQKSKQRKWYPHTFLKNQNKGSDTHSQNRKLEKWYPVTGWFSTREFKVTPMNKLELAGSLKTYILSGCMGIWIWIGVWVCGGSELVCGCCGFSVLLGLSQKIYTNCERYHPSVTPILTGATGHAELDGGSGHTWKCHRVTRASGFGYGWHWPLDFSTRNNMQKCTKITLRTLVLTWPGPLENAEKFWNPWPSNYNKKGTFVPKDYKLFRAQKKGWLLLKSKLNTKDEKLEKRRLFFIILLN